jgi:hypothetical protein
MHIFNMSKIRHSHKEYDTRGRCGTKPGPNRAKVVLAPFQNLLCQHVKEGQCMGYPMPKVGEATKHGHPGTLAGWPARQVGPLSATFAQSTDLTPL